jgi:hypothetical protein
VKREESVYCDGGFAGSEGVGKYVDWQPDYAGSRLFPHIRKDRAIFWYASGIPPKKTHRYGGEKPGGVAVSKP